MTDRDPLDDLLQQAFDADRAGRPAPDLVTPVLRRIRRRQRLRTLVLVGAAAAGLLLTMTSGLDLSGLTSALSGNDWLAGPPTDFAQLLAALLVALGGLLAIEESTA